MQWDPIKCRVWSIYILANLLVSVALTVWLYLFQIVYKGQKQRENDVSFYYSIFSGVTFGLLMVFISYYGYRVFKIRLTRRMQLHHPFASTTVMVGLTFLVFIVFLTRCIYGSCRPVVGTQCQILSAPGESNGKPCHKL